MGADEELESLRALVAQQAKQLAVLQALVLSQAEQLAQLEAENVALREQVAALKEQLAQHSGNSHRPPSSDGPGQRKSKRRNKRKSKRKRGGQPGHRGSHRALLDASEVDSVIQLFPPQCENCWAALAESPDPKPKRTQQTELPRLNPLVTEWQRHAVACPYCGHRTRASNSEGQVPTSAFGPRLTVLTALLTGHYQLSRRMAQQLLDEVFGVRMALGSVSALEHRVSPALRESVAEAWQRVLSSDVKHTDGTSWLQENKLCGLWTVASSEATVFKIVPDNSRATLEPLLGPARGILVSDRARALAFWPMASRQVCWSHLLRKFIAFSERHNPRAAEIGRILVEATRLLFSYWHAYEDGRLTRETLLVWMVPLQCQLLGQLRRGRDAGIPRLSGSCADILNHQDALWTYLTHDGVQPTNNHAEREVRGAVLWRKKSFGTQSQAGMRFVERMMSVARTARKQCVRLVAFLRDSYNAFIEGRASPSLFAAAASGSR